MCGVPTCNSRGQTAKGCKWTQTWQEKLLPPPPNAENKNGSREKSEKDDKLNHLLLQMGHIYADLCSPDSLFSSQFKI